MTKLTDKLAPPPALSALAFAPRTENEKHAMPEFSAEAKAALNAQAEARIRRVLGPDAPLVGIHDCAGCGLREADTGGRAIRKPPGRK